MAHRTAKTEKQQDSSPGPRTATKPLSARNRAAIWLMDEWMATPDDKGEEWWAEFDRFFKANRFRLRRGVSEHE